MPKEQKFSFKNLLEAIPKNAPVDLNWLRAQGVRDSYAARLAKLRILVQIVH